MTLRTRLLVFFAGLIGLLGLAEWLLLASLTERLQAERRQDAIEVGEAIFSRLGMVTELPESGLLAMDGSFGESGLVVVSPSVGAESLLAQIEAGGPVELEGWEQMPGEVQTHFTEFLRHLPTAPPALRFPPPDFLAGGAAPFQGLERADGLPGDSVTFQVFSPTMVDEQGVPIGFPFPVPLPGDEPDRRLQDFRSRLMLGTGGILLLGMLVAAFGAHRIGVPLRDLARTARQVEDGQFGATAPSGGSGEVGEVVGAFNSMSLRLAELQEEAERLREQTHLIELGELARGLAHAMRNPLNVLGLATQRLAAQQDGPERRAELAASVQAQVRRMDRALRSFLALSSSGRGPLEEVALAEICRDVALELMQSAEQGPAVRIEAPEPPVVIHGVPAELRALIQVLVVNAAEASEPGAELIVKLEQEADDGCRIEVLDRGCGLAPEQRDQLFTPHFTTKEHGAGLGLYLARRIARSRYRGDLRLEDRAGGGCRAELLLRAPKEPEDG